MPGTPFYFARAADDRLGSDADKYTGTKQRLHRSGHLGQVITEVRGDEDRGEVGFDSDLVDHVPDRVSDRGGRLGMLRDGGREP